MGLLQRIFFLIALCGLTAGLLTGSVKVGLTATGIAFITLPILLMKHFNRIHKLRYVDGKVQQALLELAPWRLLIPKHDFVVLKAGMLVHAEMFASVAEMIADAGLPPDRRAHAEFCLYKAEEKWDLAEEAIHKALQTARGAMRAAYLCDLALLIGEHKPEKLPEAFQAFDDAGCLPVVKGIEPFLFGVEGQLWTVGGAPEIGIRILEAHLPALRKKVAEDASTLPGLGMHLRFMARAHWAMGETDKARELMVQARDTFFSKQWARYIDADLARLRDELSLFDPPSEEVHSYVQDRKEDFELRTDWPGGTVTTM